MKTTCYIFSVLLALGWISMYFIIRAGFIAHVFILLSFIFALHGLLRFPGKKCLVENMKEEKLEGSDTTVNQ